MNKDRMVASSVGIIVIVCLSLIINYFVNDPMRNLQSLTDSVTPQLMSKISGVSTSNQNDFESACILVVWSDTGKVYTGIQDLIPSSHWPKTINDIDNGYLVSVTKTVGESAQFGTIGNTTTGYQVVYNVDILINGNERGSNSFAGEGLPNSIQVDPNNKSPWYGAPPSNSVIADWIKTTIEKMN